MYLRAAAAYIPPPSDDKTKVRLNPSLTEDYYNSSSPYLSSVTWVTKERRTNLSQVTFTRSLWRISRRAGFTAIRVASGSRSDWICTHERTSNKTRGATGSTLICGLTGTPAEANDRELNMETCRIFQYGDVGTKRTSFNCLVKAQKTFKLLIKTVPSCAETLEDKVTRRTWMVRLWLYGPARSGGLPTSVTLKCRFKIQNTTIHYYCYKQLLLNRSK